ncbi:MAG: 5-amino-6-(D-ribitylamino)uracil--L-tyrosine 4-hydroxyphenyl transferase CofH [Actinomycetota bacterium]|nr:5-amino-6-(D-ribitylamino)uracil--L-tyrosine 4-hydroxyphenyl transferase CofH [Actinomycetota bacterium]MDA2971202.1 5-amino-6-(D-ribitylamino)uracil--L-tyrosine 4-hydroxyphenyl transferase CofH [Actinomycetota bacterium]MDA3001088.1 5-amino-6-(D-ribitylamino)uracil--L-tyrosine 4-hydroxyphenyl transferase CofH [Actinomycetota bacterium]
MSRQSIPVSRPGVSFQHLVDMPLDDVMSEARRIRDRHHGSRVTFSPKVFIPLTMLCRDTCGYCTFAQPPARLESPYLSPDEVLSIAKRGAKLGCHEALFTLGEAPEERYTVARDWLDEHGYSSTVDYLVAMARLVLDETGLLPHANAGALNADDLGRLRSVSPSQGMMVETLRHDLACHRGAPDKTPERRLATLEHAGELRVPFTTGILVGIGETRADRLDALEAIADSHRRHGHVQEVIVQNFLPKPRTGMQNEAPCPQDEFLWSIAAARVILPPEIHLQAPPNLSDDFGVLLDAGIDDWGGVSPVTADHVNPERPWPDLDRLRDVTQSRGMNLAPRLTVYPEYTTGANSLSLTIDTPKWIDAGLRFAVLDRSDAEGLGRDDPGAMWPEKVTSADVVHDGAEVVLVGHRSTQWYSGANNEPPALVSLGTRSGATSTREAGSRVHEIISGHQSGHELGADEIVSLFRARGHEVAHIAEYADELRERAVGDVVTWVHNRNINYTNVCTFKCKFCGFSKGPLSLNLRGTPYVLTLDDIARRAEEAWNMGATEVTLQGGIHPDFDGDYYLHVTQAVKDAVPDMHMHGFTALEITEGARRNGEDLESYLIKMKNAGLASLPGTAAEILDTRARAILCGDKVDADEWLECHRVAHRVGLHSNITIMFGSIEEPESWAEHMIRTRELQKETGGFTEFIPLPFVHMASPIYLQKKSRRGPTFRETVLMHAIGRIVYDGLIDNVQVSWVKIGVPGARQLLRAGCNDLGGTLMDENISRAAGANHGQKMSEDSFRAVASPLGRSLVQRSTGYKIIQPS